MKLPIRISVPPNTKAYRIERNVRGRIDNVGSWCLWIHPSLDFSQGTYLKLYDDGAMERVTLHADGSEDAMTVKERDDATQKSTA